MALVFIFNANVFAKASSLKAVPGEYIVKLKSKKDISAAQSKSKLGKQVSIKHVFKKSGLLHVKVDSDLAKKELFSNSEIEYAEPNYIINLEPEENEISSIDSVINRQTQDSWGLEKPATEGEKVVVAIIDTGLDRSHPLFNNANAIWTNEAEKNGVPGIDDDQNGYVDDINGWNFVMNNRNPDDDSTHGTHVAGIVLSVGQDILADSIQESKVRIMPLKFLNSSGSGTTSDAVEAIYYAVDNGAKVINNSWTGLSYSQALYEAYEYANSKGVLLVAAAGNMGSNNDETPAYPANYDLPGSMSVLATKSDDTIAGFSNFGINSVSVGAPGVGIISAVPGSCSIQGCFQVKSGTSMAAPFVSGLAALAMREAPHLMGPQIKNILMDSSDKIDLLLNMSKSGGRVNPYQAIVLAKDKAEIFGELPSHTNSLLKPGEQMMAPTGGCGTIKSATQQKFDGWFLAILLLLHIQPIMVATLLKKDLLQQR
jgi:subtilisin family serine protease